MADRSRLDRLGDEVGDIGGQDDPDRLQQRLADTSVIAGRMAHDFDNILTGIIGFADLSDPVGTTYVESEKWRGAPERRRDTGGFDAG